MPGAEGRGEASAGGGAEAQTKAAVGSTTDAFVAPGSTDAARPTALRQVALDDKYEAGTGLVYLSGTQALVRLPMLQQQRDRAAGRRTAGYITGYRGSPVGAYDQALWKASRQLDAHDIRFVPGTNEDLAATALWGTQQVNLFPGARFDGVFGIWYGKGPGVDRSGDVFRHANQAGTAPFGGVLAVAGDDHGAKSSTIAAQTDFIFQAVSMPILAPATLQDYLDLGLHGFALSRYAGLWVAFKAVTDTIETAGIVDVSPSRLSIVLPDDHPLPAGGLNARWPEEPFLQLEARLTQHKLPAALAYARANRLDRHAFGRPDGQPARLGIVTSGKASLDTMQALADLGIDDATATALGVKVYRVAMPWPLEPQGIEAFCDDVLEVLVIEEKRALIETQLKERLFDAARRPRVVGKEDERRAPLVPAVGELSPAMLARLIAARLRGVAARADDATGHRLEAAWRRIDARLAELDRADQATGGGALSIAIDRIPYFCSGCPHNTSTRVPEGSRALAGIGCHYMAQWMDRSTATFTHMGGEGMTWVGQAPFTDTRHVFQNLGDGTYFHSGSLAIRHAVATRTPITYKILFNDAVAMTGGQTHDGTLTPSAIVRQVKAEGVQRVVIVTDEPDKYPAGSVDADVPIHHRRELDAVQRELRDYPGVSVLVYDQTCAAEKRRRRKRGSYPDPSRRAFINQAVCEGCGDCGVQSNCVSIEPVETEFGRKRAINQSSCNKDFSCVGGFCPSFVTIEGGTLRRGVGQRGQDDPLATVPLPDPRLPSLADGYALLITGIGGTGVVTIGQLLGMAAHLEGHAATVLDMAGLAQKNGAVMSFARFAPSSDRLHAPRIGTAAADAVIGGDVVVTAGKDALTRYRAGHTRVVCNQATTPTADFTRNADWTFPLNGMQRAIADAADREAVWFIDATRWATGLMGDAIAGNLLLLGFAYQQGLVPIGAAAIERAIELNDVAVASNLQAFRWGRRAALDPAAIDALLARDVPAGTEVAAASASAQPTDAGSPAELDAVIARRAAFLTDYQDAAYARRYTALVAEVRAREHALDAQRAHGEPLTAAVARSFFKLMAYKDEYEVARLYTSGAFERDVAARFDGAYTLRFHLAPPLWAKRDARGHLVKQSFGPWMMTAFRALARLRRLRGTRWDPFGRTEERREERRLIDEYEQTLRALLPALTPARRSTAVAIADVPQAIRGFGHVKARHLAAARESRDRLIERFHAAAAPASTKDEALESAA